MKNLITLLFITIASPFVLHAQKPVPVKPRILISTDIGGTDPDDNQSMAHFLMYSNRFETEGLVSSPSYGNGSKEHILTMIDLYEKDLPELKAHDKGFPSPDYLRSICKQGRRGAAPFIGYSKATEGSNWIIKCARKPSKQPLWVLVWGGLDDVAQALHDAPDIQNKIHVYFIGGPNKKWGANSYSYIAKNFPNLWFIEDNGSYNGFFLDNDSPEDLKDHNYYDHYIRGAGYLGKDFKNYYKGSVKMGDTPSLLYMMDGDPEDPGRDNWGGSFVRFTHSARRVFERPTTIADTVPVYSVVELYFKGPKVNIPADSACIKIAVQAKIGTQSWAGYYLGNGIYGIKYSPKQAEVISYDISSAIPGFKAVKGQFVVKNEWPGPGSKDDYKLGKNWFTDRPDASLFYDNQQGARTVSKWREAVLRDWATRWSWLNNAL